MNLYIFRSIKIIIIIQLLALPHTVWAAEDPPKPLQYNKLIRHYQKVHENYKSLSQLNTDNTCIDQRKRYKSVAIKEYAPQKNISKGTKKNRLQLHRLQKEMRVIKKQITEFETYFAMEQKAKLDRRKRHKDL